MKIAVCDDENNVSAELKRYIYEYAREHKFDVSVTEYHCADDLISANIQYGLIFLDHFMPGTNGLDAAKLLRSRGDSCDIVFLTSYSDIVFETFDVDTFRFMQKPLGRQELDKVLNAFYKPLINNQSIILKIDGTMRNIKFRDIIYVEADGKFSKVYLVNECLAFKKTMSVIEKSLQKSLFFKLHRSFIVNLDYIDRYNGEYVYTKGGHEIRIGKKYAESFKAAFVDHVKRNTI